MNASSARSVVAMLVIAAAAIAFWMLALSPQRKEADQLGQQTEELQISLSEAQSRVAEARTARSAFPADYRQLVLLGQAVPAGDETSSLLVELDHLATESGVSFDSLQMNGTGETSAPVSAETAPSAPTEPATGGETGGAVPAAATVPPTEAAASVLPLGASIGAAGLAVMPYSLSFRGSFFHIADFMKRIDSLVHTTGNPTVDVDGRLVTLDGFALNGDPELGFPQLEATMTVTTYLAPPSQGVTAGASSTEPAPATPTAAPAPESSEESSATVSAR